MTKQVFTASKPSWDSYFMAFADVAASRATCARAKVGCVIVRYSRILATGYNGPIVSLADNDCQGGVPPDGNCKVTEDGGCAETIHAEQNAVAFASRWGVSITNSTFYFTGAEPCLMCAKLLVQSGIIEVVHRWNYRKSEGKQFLKDAGVKVRLFKAHEGFEGFLMSSALRKAIYIANDNTKKGDYSK